MFFSVAAGIQIDQSVRQRDLNTKIGPNETRSSFNYTTQKRNEARNKVYSVNIPFSKYGSPQAKPATPKLKVQSHTRTSNSGFSKSHA